MMSMEALGLYQADRYRAWCDNVDGSVRRLLMDTVCAVMVSMESSEHQAEIVMMSMEAGAGCWDSIKLIENVRGVM